MLLKVHLVLKRALDICNSDCMHNLVHMYHFDLHSGWQAVKNISAVLWY